MESGTMKFEKPEKKQEIKPDDELDRRITDVWMAMDKIKNYLQYKSGSNELKIRNKKNTLSELQHEYNLLLSTKRIAELEERNRELLEALKIAVNYVRVFILRGEDPLVGEKIDDHLKQIESAIDKSRSL